MQTLSQFRECLHIKSNGDPCHSAALRGEKLCYFHHPQAREIHRMKQLALRPHPNQLALRDVAEKWPENATGKVAQLFRNGLRLALRLNLRSAAEEQLARSAARNHP